MSTEPEKTPLDREVEAYVALIRQRYGERISNDDVPRLERSVRRLRSTSAELAAFELSNGDEPATSFAAGTGE